MSEENKDTAETNKDTENKDTANKNSESQTTIDNSAVELEASKRIIEEHKKQM